MALIAKKTLFAKVVPETLLLVRETFQQMVSPSICTEVSSWVRESCGLLDKALMAVGFAFKEIESGSEQVACDKHGYSCKSKLVMTDESGGMADDGSQSNGKSSRSITLMLSWSPA